LPDPAGRAGAALAGRTSLATACACTEGRKPISLKQPAAMPVFIGSRGVKRRDAESRGVSSEPPSRRGAALWASLRTGTGRPWIDPGCLIALDLGWSASKGDVPGNLSNQPVVPRTVRETREGVRARRAVRIWDRTISARSRVQQGRL